MIDSLSSLVPSVSTPLNAISNRLETPLEAPDSLMDETQDMARLFAISENLDSVKNDAQQRSWELFDDQVAIMEYLNEFNRILVRL